MLQVFSSPTTLTLQTLLLLQRYEWHRGDHMSAWLICALATRLAHAFQLNLEIQVLGKDFPRKVSTTVEETRRRLIWSCFVMESYIEGGRRPLSTLDSGVIEVRLPCDENSFRMGLNTDMPTLASIANATATVLPQSKEEIHIGISSLLVRISVLRKQILQYTLSYHPRNIGRIPPKAPWEADAPFYGYENDLQQCRTVLPENFGFNIESMYRHHSELVSFVTYHCIFHGSYCDLYRIGSSLTASFLAGTSLRELPAYFVDHCRRGRLQHAFAISKIISESMPHHKAEYDPIVTICGCLALRILVIERRQDDSIFLGLSNDDVARNLGSIIRCAKRTAQRSEPIRNLVSIARLILGLMLKCSRSWLFSLLRMRKVSISTYPLFRSIVPALAPFCRHLTV